MRNVKVFLMCLFVMVTGLNLAYGNTYYVSLEGGDYDNIEDALDRAGRNDTVKVADGFWRGDDNTNLRYDASGVVLISENGPDDCIIDGSEEEMNCITMESDCILSGFKIRGFTQEAIEVNNEDDWIIHDCIIERNRNDSTFAAVFLTGNSTEGRIQHSVFRNNSSRQGAAVWIHGNAEVVFENCHFYQNYADSIGGCIWFSHGADGTIRNCIFNENVGHLDGGAVALTHSGTDVTISFSNIINNEAEFRWGGGLYKDENADLEMTNCIFWGNTAEYGQQIAQRIDNDNHFMDISHCIVQGGDANGQNGGWFGDEIIDERARTERGPDPIYGPNNYYQVEDSPARNAGSRDAEDLDMENFTTSIDLAPDQGVVDIGYHYDLNLYYRTGLLLGYVYDAEFGEDEPLGEAEVFTTLGQASGTTAEGMFSIPDAYADTVFTLYCTAPGYNDTTVADLIIEEDEVMEFVFHLLRPEFEIDTRMIHVSADTGDTGSVDINITNNGTGPMTWTSHTQLVGNMNQEPWTIREDFPIGQITEDAVGGVIFVDGLYYANCAHNYWSNDTTETDSNTVFVFDREGAFVDSFPQPFEGSRNGMIDMAYDGESIWSMESDSIFNYSLEGERLGAFYQDEVRLNKCMTWDPDREVLWFGYSTSDIHAITRDGELMPDMELDRMDKRFYGLAYWSEDPDGMPLYMITRETNDDTGYIYKMNPENNDTAFVYAMEVPPGKPSGGFITNGLDPFSVVFMVISEASDRDGGDRVVTIQLAGNTSWMMMDPRSGIVQAQESMGVTLSLFDERFGYGEYQGELIISHNANVREVLIPITFRVEPNSVELPDRLLPVDNSLTAYPNPFNPGTTLRFTIAHPGKASLRVYDLAGREVAELESGYFNAGHYSTRFDGSDLSTGVYLAKLNTGAGVKIHKIVLVK